MVEDLQEFSHCLLSYFTRLLRVTLQYHHHWWSLNIMHRLFLSEFNIFYASTKQTLSKSVLVHIRGVTGMHCLDISPRKSLVLGHQSQANGEPPPERLLLHPPELQGSVFPRSVLTSEVRWEGKTGLLGSMVDIPTVNSCFQAPWQSLKVSSDLLDN